MPLAFRTHKPVLHVAVLVMKGAIDGHPFFKTL